MPQAKNKIKSSAKQPETMAVHVADSSGELHGVALWNLHVLLIQDGKFWVAQGLDLDYVVQGNTIEEAKQNFEVGLESTIDLNLRMFNNIDGLLVRAPDDVLHEAGLHKSSIRLYKQITTHDIGPKAQEALPFDGVRFLQADYGKEAA